MGYREVNSISTDIVSQSIQTTNQVLVSAQAKNLELAQKLLKVTTQIKMGAESGKGELLDVIA